MIEINENLLTEILKLKLLRSIFNLKFFNLDIYHDKSFETSTIRENNSELISSAFNDSELSKSLCACISSRIAEVKFNCRELILSRLRIQQKF